MVKRVTRTEALAKATGPKPAYHATTMLNHEALMAAHGAANQPLDKQVEQVRHSIASIENDLDKAVRKRQPDRRNRLASLLSSQRAKLAYLLDKLAAAPGFNPGTSSLGKDREAKPGTFKPKAQDHASYHPRGPKPQASKGRSVRATKADRERALASIEREAQANETRFKLGRSKGSRP